MDHKSQDEEDLASGKTSIKQKEIKHLPDVYIYSINSEEESLSDETKNRSQLNQNFSSLIPNPNLNLADIQIEEEKSFPYQSSDPSPSSISIPSPVSSPPPVPIEDPSKRLKLDEGETNSMQNNDKMKQLSFSGSTESTLRKCSSADILQTIVHTQDSLLKVQSLSIKSSFTYIDGQSKSHFSKGQLTSKDQSHSFSQLSFNSEN
ncbi:unnamed protein product [Moneuplotes crassus]|uniref:Uncharacterized protein n=1 Tax=Euplotes crassus TaxID=5936 RepID=A0AAD1UDI4_EUPCR|nr:unnamed protein product [Moneuplotes crassus]